VRVETAVAALLHRCVRVENSFPAMLRPCLTVATHTIIIKNQKSKIKNQLFRANPQNLRHLRAINNQKSKIKNQK